jgi:hypothetical protein
MSFPNFRSPVSCLLKSPACLSTAAILIGRQISTDIPLALTVTALVERCVGFNPADPKYLEPGPIIGADCEAKVK